MQRRNVLIGELSKRIFEDSAVCAEMLKPRLEESYKEGTKEFNATYIAVLFEFLYFFMHLTSRIAFQRLGHEKRTMALDELGPLVVGPMIETLFADWPQNLKDGIEEDFYQSLNRAEIEYSKCKELFVKPGDELLIERPVSGKRSKGIINQLADNVANFVEKTEVCLNFSLLMEITTSVFQVLEKKKIDGLMMELAQEM